jgi:hypothetical protein
MTKSKGRLKGQNAENLAKALAGLQDRTYENAYQAAKTTGAPIRTVYDRLQGRRTRREVNVKNQALTPAEEMALVQWVQRAAATGHPVRHQFLRELAEEIRKRRLGEDGTLFTPLGKQWIQRFLKRNPTLKTQRAKSIEQARVDVTKEQVLEWFAIFKRVIQENNIKPENIYNMDETGSQTIHINTN